ncbi:MAG TPA: hypothetical protein ENN79_06175 [Desulfobacteraceae bacterium]|nr:hypothetical protein [Desulfobacteraceae bacterium]
MNADMVQKMKNFLDVLGLPEEPMGVYYTDEAPAESISPKPLDLPTREKEAANQIDWQTIFSNFSCVIGNIWRARKKKVPAVFDSARFGCPGGAFFLGFMKPQTNTIIHYVSSGVPGQMEGELYCESPEALGKIFDYIDPPTAREKYCVVKPISRFTGGEQPELVAFFTRPESLCGLHQLASFVTNDPEVVVSPWGAACTNLITWPMKFLRAGENKAVLGGWDPSARKFFKTDELSFTVPYGMFLDMLDRFEDSFLKTHTWEIVRKKISRSRKIWGEED